MPLAEFFVNYVQAFIPTFVVRLLVRYYIWLFVGWRMRSGDVVVQQILLDRKERKRAPVTTEVEVTNEQLYANVDALVVNLGLVKDDDTQPKTCLFHLWLLAFEFSETIIGVSKESLVVLTSKRKQEILEKMEVP